MKSIPSSFSFTGAQKILFGLVTCTFLSCFALAAETPAYQRTVEGVKEYSLKNGLQVLLIPDATQSNMVVNIVYKVGSRHEGYGETGMAHLLEHMLFKSTKNLGDIKKMLSEKGGNANGTTWYDRTNYYEVFPNSDDNLKWSIQMEADRMINATILQSDLDKEFSVVRNEFEIGENDPGGVLMERVISTAYLWHNYGNSTIGSREDIERVKAERLRAFYQKHYQPDNATLIVAGKFDENKALGYIGEYFAVIPRPSRVLEKTYTVEPAQDGERFVELKRAGDVQQIGALYHAAANADKDYPATDVLLEILQSDPSGYLYKALVETKKASSVFCYQPTLHDAGFAYFGVEVAKDKSPDSAKVALLRALDAIPTTEYTEQDLKRGKAKVVKQVEDVANNTIGMAITLTEYIGAGDYRLWFLYRDRVEALTLADLRKVAGKYFRPNNRTLGVFVPSGNEERVKPEEFNDEQIAALADSYKGKSVTTQLDTFEASIRNIKAHLTQERLETGFRYSFVRKPIKGGKVSASFVAFAGDEKSLSGKRETGAMMADLLTAGTKTMTKEQLQDKLDSMKSAVSFYWSGQSLIISVNTYEQSLEPVMVLVKECLDHAVFPENELEKLKAESKSALESEMNDPQSVAFTQLSKHTENYTRDHFMYTASPREQLEDQSVVTREQLVAFHAAFTGGSYAVGTIVGELDPSRVKSVMKATFGNWKSNSPFTRYLPAFSPSAKYDERITTPDKENGALACGINLDMNRLDPDYPALLMANEMLGSGGFLTSRIPTRLREKEGISYGAGSFMDIPTLHRAASWGAYAFYNPKAVDKVDVAMREEIAKAIDKGFSAEELSGSIGSWKNKRHTSLGNDGYIISLVNNSMTTNTSLDEFDNLESSVDKLTVETVNAALRKYIRPDQMVFIFAGDFSKK